MEEERSIHHFENLTETDKQSILSKIASKWKAGDVVGCLLVAEKKTKSILLLLQWNPSVL